MTKIKRLIVIRANNMQIFLQKISADRDAPDISVIINNFNIYLIVDTNIESQLPVCVVEIGRSTRQSVVIVISSFNIFLLPYLEIKNLIITILKRLSFCALSVVRSVGFFPCIFMLMSKYDRCSITTEELVHGTTRF